jgi:murein DD-endopeptidase MepM/ murein hydrolase activator NlpD
VKGLGCIGLTIIVAGISVLMGCMALYVVQAALAAESVRISPVIPSGMAQVAADRTERWVLGGQEPDTVFVAPEPGDEEPDNDGDWEVGGIYTGTVPEIADCKQPKGWPAYGGITQGFHAGHSGIDISVNTGTGVQATMCGTVIFAGWTDVGYGKLVIIANGEFKTYYAHNSDLMVGSGQQVLRNQLIALSGSTGRSTGPHVHYEVRVNDAPQDPWPYMHLN